MISFRALGSGLKVLGFRVFWVFGFRAVGLEFRLEAAETFRKQPVELFSRRQGHEASKPPNRVYRDVLVKATVSNTAPGGNAPSPAGLVLGGLGFRVGGCAPSSTSRSSAAASAPSAGSASAATSSSMELHQQLRQAPPETKP